jgi:hypothetical protein
MLSFTHVLDLLVDELPGGGRWGLAFFEVALRSSDGFLFRHSKILLALKDANFVQCDVQRFGSPFATNPASEAIAPALVERRTRVIPVRRNSVKAVVYRGVGDITRSDRTRAERHLSPGIIPHPERTDSVRDRCLSCVCGA